MHILSDWKWTGPAEPTLNLCAALRTRGHHVLLACRASQSPGRQSLPQTALDRGFAPIVSMRLEPSLKLKPFRRDVRELRHLVAEHRFDVLHLHHDHDTLISYMALGGRGKRQVAVVRSHHSAAMPSRCRGWLYKHAVDGVVTVSQAQQNALARHFPPEALAQTFGVVDLERFQPRPATERGRELLGVPPDAFVVGVVARVQRHRRFDLFLDAIKLAAARVPNLRGVVMGRGTHREEVAIQPARRMGLAERVLFPGYIGGDDYVEALAAFDVKVFLVPGSDGSCRAAREFMAMGKPVVATRRHPLPEIVDHGATGLLVDESPAALADALVQLARAPQLGQEMGQRARAKAEAEFCPERELAAVETVYDHVLKCKDVMRGP